MSRKSIIIVCSLLLIVSLVPRDVKGAPSSQPKNVPVNLLIDYGNGTLVWINNTSVPSNWNFYNVTNLDTAGNIASIFFASFGSHFVYQINGVGCPSTNPFCDNSWGLWILQGSCWTLSTVGLDEIPVSYHATVGWYLVPAEVLGNTPPTGASCAQVNIDVKPPSDPAVINSRAGGTIAVAILSDQTFNVASQVVVSALTFGETGTEHSLEFCNNFVAGNETGILCHFETQSTGFHPGDTEAILNGQTTSGTPFFGTDNITVLKSNSSTVSMETGHATDPSS